MFLKELHIKNYKSISDAKIKLNKSFNILIGQNGAGKSNFLEFISRNINIIALSNRTRYSRAHLADYSFSLQYIKDKKNIVLDFEVKKEKRFSKEEIEFISHINVTKKINNRIFFEKAYELGTNSTRESRKKNSEFYNDTDIFRWLSKKYITFNIPEDKNIIAIPSKYSIDESFTGNFEAGYSEFSIVFEFELFLERELFKLEETNADAINNESFFSSFFLEKFDQFVENTDVVDYLKKFSPISNLRLNRNINVHKIDSLIIVENIIMEFQVNKAWVPWSFLSDGTKRLFYIITECIVSASNLLLIEEPELGIHPHQLYKLMNFLKEQSISKQLIISTHSPIALDVLEPNELDKIIITKITEKGTTFNKLTKSQIEAAQIYMKKFGDLSYYWLHSDLEND